MTLETPVAAIFYDGKSNARRVVNVYLGAALNITEDRRLLASWPLADIRRHDAGDGLMRLGLSTNPLSRLEVDDPALQHRISADCPQLYGSGSIGSVSNLHIVAWSLAAVFSIVVMIFCGIPLLASSLTPLLPYSLEKRLGDAVNAQTRAVFGGKDCTAPEGVAAFQKLVMALQSKAHLPYAPKPAVLSSKVPNAFALPGGNVYVLQGLLDKATNADELAGVLAHEFGHVAHRDGLRMLIENGGTSFLAGLLFGDITGAGVVLTLGRTLVDARYSRSAESAADAFAIQVMADLGRSPKPMGELLLRITGNEKDNPLAIFASHPITAERVAAFNNVSNAVTGPEILSAQEWRALKDICK